MNFVRSLSTAVLRSRRLRWVGLIGAIVLCAGLYALHAQQERVLAQLTSQLGTLSQARIDFNNSFLRAALGSPTRAKSAPTTDHSMLNQASLVLQQVIEATSAETHLDTRPLREHVRQFAALLAQGQKDAPGTVVDKDLLQAFHQLDSDAAQADAQIRHRLITLDRRFRLQSYVALGFSLSLICLFSLGLFLLVKSRRDAEHLEQEQERRIRFVLKAMKAGTWEWDLDAGTFYWSEALGILYGIPAQLGPPSYQNWRDSVHPDDLEQVEATIRESVQQGSDLEFEWRVKLPPEEPERWIGARGQYRPATSGKGAHYVGIALDISAQHEAMERRQQAATLSNELRVLQQILDSALAGYWDLNTAQHSAYLSPTFKHMLGYEDSELPNTLEVWQKLVAEDDLEQLQALFAEHIASKGATRINRELRCRHKDGSMVWVIVSGCVVEWKENGKPARITGCIIDITRLKALEQLREQAREERLATILDNVGAHIYIKDCEYRYIYANRRVCDSIGIPLEALIGHDDFAILGSEAAASLRRNDERVITLGERIELEETAPTGNNHELRTYLSVKLPLRNPDGSVAGLCGISTDITERKAIEEALREKDQLFQEMSKIAHVGAWAFDPVSGKGTWTEETARIHEVAPDVATNIAFAMSFYEGESQVKVEEAVREALGPGRPYDLELEMTTAQGHHKWVRTVGHPQMKDGKVVRIHGAIQDITQSKESQNRIWREANFDALTGLPNRRMLYDRLDQEIRKAKRAGTSLAIMLLDLDRFKEVNDSLGHDKGDLLLKDASERISNCVRDTDTVARLGGDEFIIVLPLPDEPTHVERVASDVLLSLEQAFQLGADVAYVSASIGITLYPDDAETIDDLFKNADQAMYAAKNQGRNRCSYFTPYMQHAAQLRMQIATDLRSALGNSEFELHYQPIVELATGQIRKAEALIRWQHPLHGLISPAAFIPIAEETRAIIEIGNWVLQMAAQQVSRWRKDLHPEFQISINKSPVQFLNDVASTPGWLDLLQKLDLPRRSVVMEITEGLLLKLDPLVEEKFARFHELGIEVALDDFGTGYSSLSYIKKFDIDYLKIDQSFVSNLAPGSNDMALCEAIIVMAHKLDIKVIAEGIETVAQRDLLAAAGCDFGQGFLFSPPVPAEAFERLPQFGETRRLAG